MNQLQFMKDVQVRTTHLCLLLYFGIAALFRIGEKSLPCGFVQIARIAIVIAGILAILYHVHTTIEFPKRREEEGIPKQTFLTLIYAILHFALVVLGGIVAFMITA